MFDKLRRLLESNEGAPKNEETPVETAVARLLVRAAMVDGTFHASEREAVLSILTRRLGNDQERAGRLIADAEQHDQQAVEIFGSTKTVKDGLDHEARLEVLEELWEVILADGRIDDYEANLMRRLAGLLHVTDRESGEARRRAVRKKDADS